MKTCIMDTRHKIIMRTMDTTWKHYVSCTTDSNNVYHGNWTSKCISWILGIGIVQNWTIPDTQ